MKKHVLLYSSALLVLSLACNSGDKPVEEKVVTDSIPKKDTLTVATEPDSAATIAYYAEQHKKDKGVPNTNSKSKGNKKVSIHSDPIFATADVISTKNSTAAAYDTQMFYFIEDEKATFPGGEKAFDKYLLNNLEYPEKALEAEQSRTVYATFFIDEQGTPLKVEFRYEPSIYGFQDEASRILMKSPKWNPAKVAGSAVKSKFTIPITFKLDN